MFEKRTVTIPATETEPEQTVEKVYEVNTVTTEREVTLDYLESLVTQKQNQIDNLQAEIAEIQLSIDEFNSL